ncbi:SusC/RagA family TonB-linked outer membrane protein [Chondrinema litorale]|uniref:SusC/RagA family TonB-linked outer membrane protein n=1 Tax=Chondrinema litorale TaxID=2994555 RepID=UPI002543AD1C|nr:TonB-dependent receptor [Chondrinema litorale]UZR98144.1 TonB-dependent receptor [Chondrinema litorale]
MKLKLLHQVWFMTKLIFYGCILQCMFLSILIAKDSSAQSLHDIYLDVRINDVSLKKAFSRIEARSNFQFLYPNDLDLKQTVNLDENDATLGDMLIHFAKDAKLKFKRVNNTIVVEKSDSYFNSAPIEEEVQQVRVAGKVISGENNEPLPGVSILVKGSNNGTTTDINGEYNISVTSGSILQFSFIGFVTDEVEVNTQSEINVTLEPDSEQLDEIIVVGYGTQKKTEVTGAVASVKEKDFTAGAMRDASELIKGKVAGLKITNGSGDPSSESSILLRGVSSIAGSTTPLILINGVPGSINDLAPSDISSIDVLKDASAAAIYGTRGANGVILITTKSASRDIPTSLTYSHYSAISSLGKKADFLDAGDMRNLISEGYTLPFEDKEYNTDWLDLITQKGYIQNHNLNLRGGNGTSSYSANVNYMDQEGVFTGSENKEFKISLDLNHYMFDDKLKINVNLLRGNQEFGALGDGASFNSLIYRQALIRNPTDRPLDDEGNWIETSRFQYYNPVAMIKETDGIVQNNWTRLTANTTLYLLPGWETNLLLATKRFDQFRGYSETKRHYSNTLNGRNGFASRGDAASKTDNLELTTKYSKISGSHKLSAMAGYSYQYIINEGGWASNYNFPTDAYSYNNLGHGQALQDGKASMGSYKNDNTLAGFFGRVTYNFDDRFNVLASIRREGSSKFGNNYKWGTFPAVSAAWTLSNETFLKSASFIDNLKLRVGYGVTGRMPNDSYLSQTVYTYTGTVYYNNGEWVKGLTAGNSPNPNLRWEKSMETNIGLDFAILNNRVSGAIDLYNKKTTDLLYQYSLPKPPNVSDNVWANVGEMENKGIEILLNTVPVRSEGFEWNSTLTFSYNQNKLTKLSNDLYEIEGDYFNTGNAGDPISFATHRVEVGQAIGNFWGLKTVDITEDGQWVIETSEGETKTLTEELYNDDNKQYLGNGLPNFNAGWTNTFRYKGFDLSIVLTGAFDYQILNFQRMFYENPTINYNMLTTAFDEVYGKAVLDYPQTYVSYYIEDGDYVKLENITLGYNFNASKISFIESFRVYASGSNLATITGYKGLDPELAPDANFGILASGNDNRDKYPITQTYTLGLNITF